MSAFCCLITLISAQCFVKSVMTLSSIPITRRIALFILVASHGIGMIWEYVDLMWFRGTWSLLACLSCHVSISPTIYTIPYYPSLGGVIHSASWDNLLGPDCSDVASTFWPRWPKGHPRNISVAALMYEMLSVSGAKLKIKMLFLEVTFWRPDDPTIFWDTGHRDLWLLWCVSCRARRPIPT